MSVFKRQTLFSFFLFLITHPTEILDLSNFVGLLVVGCSHAGGHIYRKYGGAFRRGQDHLALQQQRGVGLSCGE